MMTDLAYTVQVKKKAIIFDLDGTAVDSPEQKLPSERLIKAVSALKSKYYLCSATGRVWTFAKPVLSALKLSDPCIISAGTQICNPLTGEVLWQKTIPEQSLIEVIEVFKKYPDYKLLYNDNDEHEYFHGGMSPSEFVTTEPVYFLEQVFVPGPLADEVRLELQKVKGVAIVMVNAQKPDTKDIHVLNMEATKEQAVTELLKIIGVEKSNTIGVGDGGNDLHLFNGVEYRVAMGNAVEDLKSLADLVIGSIKDDGLAEYFESLGQIN